MVKDSKKVGGGYMVGYGQPPKEHQFQKGKSGNPSGGPKRPRVVDSMRKVIERKVDIRGDGELKRVPVTEALMLQLVQSALGGNRQDRLELIRMCESLEESEAAVFEAADELGIKEKKHVSDLYDFYFMRDGLVEIGFFVLDPDGRTKISPEMLARITTAHLKFPTSPALSVLTCFLVGTKSIDHFEDGKLKDLPGN